MSGSARDFTIAPGHPAPVTGFIDAAGKKLSLPDLLAQANGLPLLLVFFKVGCPTCQLLWPYLQRLHALYGGRAVHVAGVCQNSAAECAAHYRDYGDAAFDLLLDPEPRFPASNDFGVEAVPHLVLVSPGGSVETSFTGWSRRAMNALAVELARAGGLVARPLVDPADPVKEWQAG